MEYKSNGYLQAFTADKVLAQKYYKKSLVKTEQQKLLEEILSKDESFSRAVNIADVACGGGTLSYHLALINKKSRFHLYDLYDEALTTAAQINKNFGDRFQFSIGDISNLESEHCQYDFVFCWQTLFVLDNPELALLELLKITKPGGKIFISSLFNLKHDVDIYSKFIDHTRTSGSLGMSMNYNTYSSLTVNKWLLGKVAAYKFHEFHPSIDFEYDGRGIGTFTKKCDTSRIQISGGMLMNWAILEITK